MHDLKSEPALSVIRAIGRPEVFADEAAVLVPDDIGLIVRNDDAVVLRQPRQIKADLPGQHGQKIGRILRHVLHFLRAVRLAGDPADGKRRVTADELRGVPATILSGCRTTDFFSGLPLLSSDIRAFRQNLIQRLCRTLTVGHNSHGRRRILRRCRKLADAGDNDIIPESVDDRRSRRRQRQRRRDDNCRHGQPRQVFFGFVLHRSLLFFRPGGDLRPDPRPAALRQADSICNALEIFFHH